MKNKFYQYLSLPPPPHPPPPKMSALPILVFILLIIIERDLECSSNVQLIR